MGLESKVVEDAAPLIDREKTCPLLLRVFCNLTGRHNSKIDYHRGLPGNELQIYTWLDANLKELTRLITEVYPDAKAKGSTFNFCVTWPSPRMSNFVMKEIGQTTIGTKGPDDNATLKSKQFVIGDYLDVAITIARSNQSSYSRDSRDSKSMRSSDSRRQPYRDYR